MKTSTLFLMFLVIDVLGLFWLSSIKHPFVERFKVFRGERFTSSGVCIVLLATTGILYTTPSLWEISVVRFITAFIFVLGLQLGLWLMGIRSELLGNNFKTHEDMLLLSEYPDATSEGASSSESLHALSEALRATQKRMDEYDQTLYELTKRET